MSNGNKTASMALPTKADISFTGISEQEIAFTVKKLPLGRVINLLNAVQELPKEIANIDKMDESEILQNISTLIAMAIPKFVDVVVEAIDDEKITADTILEEFGLDNIINTIYLILVVNNVLGIMQTIKKMQALTRPPQAPQLKIATGS